MIEKPCPRKLVCLPPGHVDRKATVSAGRRRPRVGLARRSTVASLDAATITDLTALNDTIVRQEGYWLRRLSQMRAVELPYADHSSTTLGQNYATAVMSLPAGVSAKLTPSRPLLPPTWLASAAAPSLTLR